MWACWTLLVLPVQVTFSWMLVWWVTAAVVSAKAWLGYHCCWGSQCFPCQSLQKESRQMSLVECTDMHAHIHTHTQSTGKCMHTPTHTNTVFQSMQTHIHHTDMNTMHTVIHSLNLPQIKLLNTNSVSTNSVSDRATKTAVHHPSTF